MYIKMKFSRGHENIGVCIEQQQVVLQPADNGSQPVVACAHAV